MSCNNYPQAGTRASIGHRNEAPRTARDGGFTLTQLLVTIAIVAILASMGYPSYRAQIVQSRRAAMQSQLLALAQFMERRHAETGCYNAGLDDDCTTTGDAGLPPELTLPWAYPRDGRPDDPDYYTVTLVDGTLGRDTFTFQATPIRDSAQDGDGALFIDHAQRRWWDEDSDGRLETGEDDWKRG
jgi:type IV pilus assembly protein PilE